MRQRSAVGEVEAQLVRPHRRARLAHVRPESFTEGRVQEVRRGVVAHRREARDVVHLRLDALAGTEPVARAVELHRLVLADPVDVGDLGAPAVPAHLARVGDLASTLGVERALLQLDQGPAVVAL